MWFQSLALTLLAFVGDVGAATEAKMTQFDVVDYFRNNPLALPAHGKFKKDSMSFC
jgi:hypothetical protein